VFAHRSRSRERTRYLVGPDRRRKSDLAIHLATRPHLEPKSCTAARLPALLCPVDLVTAKFTAQTSFEQDAAQRPSLSLASYRLETLPCIYPRNYLVYKPPDAVLAL
jgi:hypothetical protein